MRVIAGLIALAGVAGLVALIAPLDELGSLLPLLFEHELVKGLVLVAAFGLAVGLGGFAMAKERMSRLHSVATLVGFAAAGVIIEIWTWIGVLTRGDNLPGSMAIMTGAVVLGAIASIAGLIKGRAAY
jgi:hypothetical protein